MALTLMALLLTGLYGSFYQTTRVQQAVEVERDAYQQVRLALMLLTDEFSAAYSREEGSGADAAVLIGTGGGPDTTRQDRIELVTLSGAAGPRHVRVFVMHAPGGSRLVQTVETQLGGLAETVELVEGVKAFTLRYYDGSAWVDSWDGLSTRRLPAAIGIKLAVGGPAGQIWTFATAVEIPVGRQT